MSKEQKEFVVQPGAPRDKSKIVKYTRKRKGIPLPAGCTFQDLSTEQRTAIMQQGENQWKKEYNKKRGTISSMATLTRGFE
jgi:hypothetical protein